MTVVHQLLSGAGPHDAITTEALTFRRWFTDWGWGGSDHAYRIHPALAAPIAPAAQLAPRPEDVVLLHHSAGWPRLDAVLELAGRKLLLYHNVTPAAWFWIDVPGLGAHCQVGRDQLLALVGAADATAADSAFNASELSAYGARGTEVIHLLLDSARLGAGDREFTSPADSLSLSSSSSSSSSSSTESGPAVSSAPDPVPAVAPGSAPPAAIAPNVLFVGRLSPHKRQDEIIRAFGLYRRVHAPEATLTLIGAPVHDRYVEHLRRLAAEHAPGAVRIESDLAESELAARYRDADVFLCLSEHEGFCIPLVEAFSYGVPVIARPYGAVPEVAANAALLVPDGDPAVIAELLALVVGDASLRAELIRRGHERLAAFTPERITPHLRAAVQRAEAGAGARR